MEMDGWSINQGLQVLLLSKAFGQWYKETYCLQLFHVDKSISMDIIHSSSPFLSLPKCATYLTIEMIIYAVTFLQNFFIVLSDAQCFRVTTADHLAHVLDLEHVLC